MKTAPAAPLREAPVRDAAFRASLAHAVATPDVADVRTRDRVAHLLLELGPSTAAALGKRLGLSAAAVRRHLDAMVAAGTLTSAQQRSYGRRRRGRPARVFALTDAGHAAAGPVAYDELAASALRFIAERDGIAAVAEFAAARAREVERGLREIVDRLPSQDRPQAVADALTEQGYAAAVLPTESGAQLCQHHCPVQHVAEQFPQLCEAETAMLSSLLGTHVQRLATIAHGDGVCTTYIPAATHIPLSELSASLPRRGVPEGPQGSRRGPAATSAPCGPRTTLTSTDEMGIPMSGRTPS